MTWCKRATAPSRVCQLWARMLLRFVQMAASLLAYVALSSACVTSRRTASGGSERVAVVVSSRVLSFASLLNFLALVLRCDALYVGAAASWASTLAFLGSVLLALCPDDDDETQEEARRLSFEYGGYYDASPPPRPHPWWPPSPACPPTSTMGPRARNGP